MFLLSQVQLCSAAHVRCWGFMLLIYRLQVQRNVSTALLYRISTRHAHLENRSGGLVSRLITVITVLEGLEVH